jgi:hypothetical protein
MEFGLTLSMHAPLIPTGLSLTSHIGEAGRREFHFRLRNGTFGADIAADQLWFRQVGSSLEVSVIGSTDKFTVSNWYSGSPYHVEQFKTADGKVLLDTQVQNLVHAMAGFAPPASGQTTLPANYQSSLNPVIAANW